MAMMNTAKDQTRARLIEGLTHQASELYEHDENAADILWQAAMQIGRLRKAEAKTAPLKAVARDYYTREPREDRR